MYCQRFWLFVLYLLLSVCLISGQTRNENNEEEGEGLKVLRGGSMADQNPHVHRLTNRLGYDPRQRFDYTVGFRCARDLPQ